MVGLGFNIIYNATDIINFAQGEFVMIGGMVMISLTKGLKIPMIPSFFFTIIIVAIIGILLERPVRLVPRGTEVVVRAAKQPHFQPVLVERGIHHASVVLGVVGLVEVVFVLPLGAAMAGVDLGQGGVLVVQAQPARR